MENDNVETPGAKVALEVARSATSNSSGKDILKRYRELVAQKSAGKSLTPSDNEKPDAASPKESITGKKADGAIVHNLESELNAEQLQKAQNKAKAKASANNIRMRMKSRPRPQSCFRARKPPQTGPANISSPKPNSSFSGTEIEYSTDSTESSSGGVTSSASDASATTDSEKGGCGLPNSMTTSPVTSSEDVEEDRLSDDNGKSIWAMMGELSMEQSNGTVASDEEETSGESTISGADKNGVKKEPGELISFLGESFLTETSRGDGSLGQGSELPRDFENGDIALSPLHEGSEQADVDGGGDGDDHACDSDDAHLPLNDGDVSGGASQQSLHSCRCERGVDVSNESSQRELLLISSQASRIVSNGSQESISTVEEDDGNYSMSSTARSCSFPTHDSHTPLEREPASPMTSLRRNSMQQALEESEVYTKRIDELAAALDSAQSAMQSESNERKKCEKRIEELLAKASQYEAEISSLRKNQNDSTDKNVEALDRSAIVSPSSKSRSVNDESTTASLLERNKTLVKEVRFADQTCVELSERNTALQTEIDRLQKDLRASKRENESLHNEVVCTAKHGAKIEANCDALNAQLSDQRERFRADLSSAEARLELSQKEVASLTNKLKESNEASASLELSLAASQARVESLSSNYDEAKQTIASITDQLATCSATSHLSAESAAASFKDSYNSMQQQLEGLHKLCQDREKTINFEKEQKEQITTERNDLKIKCSDLEAQIVLLRREITGGSDGESNQVNVTSVVMAEQAGSLSMSSLRTPTSQQLANTLRSELKHSHAVNGRVAELETELAEANVKLHRVSQQLESSKADTSKVEKELEEATLQLQKILQETESGNADGNLTETSSPNDAKSIARDLQNALGDNRVLTARVSSCERTIRDLETQLDESRQDCDVHLKARSEANLQVKQLREKMLSLTRSIERDKEAIEEKARGLVQHAVLSLVSKCDALRLAMETKLGGCSSAVQQLESKVRYLQLCFDFESQSVGDKNEVSRCTLLQQDGPSLGTFDVGSESSPLDTIQDDEVLNATFASERPTTATPHTLEDGILMELMEEARPELFVKDASPTKSSDLDIGDAIASFDQSSSNSVKSKSQEGLNVPEEKCVRETEEEKKRLSHLLDAAHLGLQDQKKALSQLQYVYSTEQKGLLGVIASLYVYINKIQAEATRISECLTFAQEKHAAEKLELQKHVSELQSDLKTSQGLLENAQAELSSFRQDAANTLNVLENKKCAIDKEVLDLRKQVKTLNAELEQEQGRLKESEKDAEKCRQDLIVAQTAFEQESDENFCEAEALRDSVSVMEGKLGRCESDLESKRQRIDKLENDLAAVQEKYADAITSFHECSEQRDSLAIEARDLKVVHEEKQKLEHALREALQRISSISSENELTKARCSELEERGDRLHSLNVQDAATIDELRSCVNQSTSEMDRLKISYVTCNDKLANALEQIANNEIFIEELNTVNRATQEELAAASKRFSDSQKKVAELEQSKSAASADAQKAAEEMNAYRCNVETLLAQKEAIIEKLDTTYKETQRSVEGKVASFMEANEAETKKLEASITVLKSQLAATKEEAQQAATKFGMTIEELNEKIEHDQRVIQAEKTDTMALRQHASEQQHALDEAVDEVLRCRATIAVLDAEVLRQNENLQKVEQNKQNTIIEKEVLHRSEADLRKRLAEAKGKEDELKKQVENTQKRLEITSYDLDATSKRLQEAEKSKVTMERQLFLALNDFERLKVELHDTEGKLRASQMETSDVRDSSMQRLEEKDRSIALLTKQKEKLAHSLTLAQKSVLKAEGALRVKSEESTKLTHRTQSLERKCIRLREYIKKLTAKCEEWADSYNSQSADLYQAKHEQQEAVRKVADLVGQIDVLTSEIRSSQETSSPDQHVWTDNKGNSALEQRDVNTQPLNRRLKKSHRCGKENDASSKLSIKSHKEYVRQALQSTSL